MSRPVVQTKALTAGNTTVVAAAQTLGAAGNLTLASTTVTLDTARKLLFTSTSDLSALTATIYGTDKANGNVIVDSTTLPSSGTATSNLNFYSVTRIFVSGAVASNLSVGTNTVGSTPWVLSDPYLTPSYWSLVAQLVSGSGNATIEYTSDPIIGDAMQSALGYGYATPNPLAIAHPTMQGFTITTEGAIDFPITGWRLTVNSGTGTWKVTGIQAGLIQ